MGSATNYLEDKLMDHVFNVAYTPAATLYLALATADPGETATGASMSEVANSGNYTRTAITFGAASSRSVTQNATVTFPIAMGAWGTVTHWAIVDSATHGAGNALAYGSFLASKSPISGSTMTVASGQIVISITAGQMSDFLANKLLDLAFRNTAYSKPATWIALTTVPVTDGMTGSTITEPSGSGYARVQVNINGGSSPTWNLSSGGNVDNAHAITVGPASGGSWGTAVAVAVVSLTSAGDLLWYDNSMTDTAVADGDSIQFTTGNCDWTLS